MYSCNSKLTFMNNKFVVLSSNDLIVCNQKGHSNVELGRYESTARTDALVN